MYLGLCLFTWRVPINQIIISIILELTIKSMHMQSFCMWIQYVHTSLRVHVQSHRWERNVRGRPCSWLVLRLWCGSPPAGTVCALVMCSVWPLWACTREPSPSPSSHADASPAWAAHSAGLRFLVPAARTGSMALFKKYLDKCTVYDIWQV